MCERLTSTKAPTSTPSSSTVPSRRWVNGPTRQSAPILTAPEITRERVDDRVAADLGAAVDVGVVGIDDGDALGHPVVLDPAPA